MSWRVYLAWAASLVLVLGVGLLAGSSGAATADGGVYVAWVGSVLLALCFGRWISARRMVASAVAAATGGDADARALASASPRQVVVIGGRFDESSGALVYHDLGAVGEYDHVIARGVHDDGAHYLGPGDDDDGEHDHVVNSRPYLPAGRSDGATGDGVRVDRHHRAVVDHGRLLGDGRAYAPAAEVVRPR